MSRSAGDYGEIYSKIYVENDFNSAGFISEVSPFVIVLLALAYI